MLKRKGVKKESKTKSLIKKYARRKSKVQTFVEEGLECTGRKELQFVKECKKSKKVMPTKALKITTPIGDYTPDFEFKDKYIEIKSIHTFMCCLGLISYKGRGPVSSKQWQKIKWVATHIKPVEIIIYLSTKEPVPIININEPNVTITVRGGKLLVL